MKKNKEVYNNKRIEDLELMISGLRSKILELEKKNDYDEKINNLINMHFINTKEIEKVERLDISNEYDIINCNECSKSINPKFIPFSNMFHCMNHKKFICGKCSKYTFSDGNYYGCKDFIINCPGSIYKRNSKDCIIKYVV